MTLKTTHLRILIVDENQAALSALRATIASQPDLELVGSASGVGEAVDTVRRLRPDVVVLDVSMRNGGGVRLAREISAATAGARIIAFSASDGSLIRKVMLSAGATDYVSKLASAEELLVAIRAVPLPEDRS
jgi:DNA-binding NarL/FixJ family response regulator